MPTTVNPTRAIELSGRDLAYGYDSGQPVVGDLSVRLHGGQLCALIGPNASGKSTLVRLLAGQLSPWCGTVQLDGHNVTGLSARQRAHWISYVPQRSATGFAFTVAQVVAMGRHALPLDPDAVDHAMQLCQLMSLRDRPYTRLSLGQQQRVLLARAVAQASGAGRVMLLDEPDSGMDLWHVHHTMNSLVTLARNGLGVLVVLHDPNLAARYADTIWLMDRGRIAASGPWQAVLCPQILEPVYRVSITPLRCGDQPRPLFLIEPKNDSSDTMTSSGDALSPRHP